MWIEAVYYLLWSDMLFINFLRVTGGVTLYERFFLLWLIKQKLNNFTFYVF